jgi:hypothetical protein
MEQTGGAENAQGENIKQKAVPVVSSTGTAQPKGQSLSVVSRQIQNHCKTWPERIK